MEKLALWDNVWDNFFKSLLLFTLFKLSATTAGQDSKIVIRADVAQLVEQLIRNE